MRDVHSDEVRAPALRLEGFEGEWSEVPLGSLVERVTRRNKGLQSTLPLTISAQHGLVDQVSYFNNHVVGQNWEDYFLVKNGEFAYNKSASAGYPAGTVKRLDRYESGILSVLYVVFGIEDPNTLDSDYLATYFETELWPREVLLRAAEGARNHGLLNISAGEFLDIPIAVPPSRAEQVAIGAFFKNLDGQIRSTLEFHSSLTSLKKTMLVKMFPQGTASTPEVRFEGFEGDWECEYLGTRAEVKSAARVHRHEWTTSGVPFFRASDVSAIANGISNPPAFISHELYENLVTRSGRLRKGDVLVVGGGSIGTPYVVPDDKPLYSKDADLLWVQSDRERLSPEYLATFFRSPSFQQYLRSISHAGTISHYTIVQAKNTPIPLPSLSEQQAIGAYFRSLDALIDAEQKKLDTLRSLKSALLTQMFV